MSDPQTAAQDLQHDRAAWLNRMSQIGDMHGFFDRIGQDHHAFYVQEGDTLLVSFDGADRIRTKGVDQLPVGFEAVKKREWSMLSIIATGPTWFRDPALYAFFDRLVDEDFFDSFDQVIFLGAGPMCGYAAAAFSVVAPGAQVIALSPAATLDRETAPFELRYRNAWRKNFNDRYGYAPDMLEAAAKAFVIYDPADLLNAAHAALFRGKNIERIRFRGAGPDQLTLLEPSGNLDRMLKAAGNDRFHGVRFAKLIRRLRRHNVQYLRRLLARSEERGGDRLSLIVARHGATETDDPLFKTRAADLEARLNQSA